MEQVSDYRRVSVKMPAKVRRSHILSFLELSKLPVKSGVAYEQFIARNELNMCDYRCWQRHIQFLMTAGRLEVDITNGGIGGCYSLIKKVKG